MRNKKYTAGLADIEMTMEALKKRRAKKKKEEWFKSQEKGGKSNESNSKS